MAQTYYEILGVAENATAEEIEAAFRKRARDVHPDTVAPGNSYLRQVAAEAFKDLSEAKAILLNPNEREKYDLRLKYGRDAENSDPASAAPQPGAAGERSTPPRGQAAQAQRGSQPRRPPQAAAPKRQRPPLRIVWKPAKASLVSFAFVVLGVATIFFIGWLILTDSMPPAWITLLTVVVGALSVRHGLKPTSNVRVRKGMV